MPEPFVHAYPARTLREATGLNPVAATMNLHFRERWRELKRGRPGSRFLDRYRRARHENHRHAARRVGLMLVGAVFLVLGIVFAVIPGPAIPFFFVAGALLATESRTIARFMDWSEVRLRQLAAWGKRLWRRLPTIARVLLLILAACLSAGGMYLSYRVMRG